ncbi:hypothetical protein D3C85_1547130 [compost metagenome]
MNITGMVSVDKTMTSAVPNDAIVEADGKFYIFVHTDKQVGTNEGEKSHVHKEGDKHEQVEEKKEHGSDMNFEKVEVVKGVSELGYTAITPVGKISKDAKIVTKGAFFINAKLSNSGGHDH